VGEETQKNGEKRKGEYEKEIKWMFALQGATQIVSKPKLDLPYNFEKPVM
jgi:hypothetical protein